MVRLKVGLVHIHISRLLCEFELPNYSEGWYGIDLGSGAGIDVFLATNTVKDSGKVIGIDMTDTMHQKAKKNAADGGYTNVEFRKGDIEDGIPVDDNSVDVVTSNCVINLTTDKVKTFREIHRILKPNGIGKNGYFRSGD